jgi:hypothetical protein
LKCSAHSVYSNTIGQNEGEVQSGLGGDVVVSGVAKDVTGIQVVGMPVDENGMAQFQVPMKSTAKGTPSGVWVVEAELRLYVTVLG